MGVSLNIIVLGNWCVGKTALIRRFSENRFVERYFATVVEDCFGNTGVVDGLPVVLWDIVGLESVEKLGHVRFDACILTYDVTAPMSFMALDKWRDQFLKKVRPGERNKIPFVLVGTKLDLVGYDATFVTWTHPWSADLPHFFVSAKTGFNFDEAFRIIIDLAKEYKLSTDKSTNSVNTRDSDDQFLIELSTDSCCPKCCRCRCNIS